MKPAIRQKTNIIIDLVMFVVMILLAIIGIVIRYTLLPGSERWVKYGQNVELTIWGMDRHEWGLVHLIVGLILVGLLVLHLVFHWSQIVIMLKRLIPNGLLRSVIVASVIVLSAVILIAPLLMSPKIGDPIIGKGQRIGGNGTLHPQGMLHTSVENKVSKKEIKVQEQATLSENDTKINDSEVHSVEIVMQEEQHTKEEHTLNIRGYNTFFELAEEYNISAEKLKKSLGIPTTVSNNERLGRIRRNYGFTMSEVENSILKLQKNKSLE